jgi:hypothetical protein
LITKVCGTQKLDIDKINYGQAGSRPGRNAIDVVIQKEMKEMKYLYSRITRTGMGTMDNNAKVATTGSFAI